MAVVVGLPVLLLGALIVFEPPLSLAFLKGPIEAEASRALGHRVVIGGPLTLIPRMSPSVQIEDVTVASPEGWQGSRLARLRLARLRVAVLPLLEGEVLLDEVIVDGLELNLEVAEDGAVNWPTRAGTDGPPHQSPPAPQDIATPPPLALRHLELDSLSIRDIAVRWQQLGADPPIEFRIDQIVGSARDREPVTVSITGSLQRQPYSAELRGGSIVELFTGSSPWPLALSGRIAGIELAIDGALAEPLRAQGMAFEFDLSGPNISELGKLLELDLPALRSFELRGKALESEGQFRIADLDGEIAGTHLGGTFNADMRGERPRVSGEVLIDSVDVEPLMNALHDAGMVARSAPPTDAARAATTGAAIASTFSPATGTRVIEAPAFDLDRPLMVFDLLSRIDARLGLHIKEVVNAPASVRDAVLEVEIGDGELYAPVALEIAGVPLEGELRLRGVPAASADSDPGGPPAVDVRVSGSAADVRELARFLTGLDGVEGRFAEARIAYEARGRTVRELLLASRIRATIADAELSYGNDAGGRPVGFTLTRAEVDFPLAAPSRIAAEGTLLGVPFALSGSSGNVSESVENGLWPVEFQLRGGGTEVHAEGASEDHGKTSRLAVKLRGDRLGDLAAWLGVSPDAAMSYEIDGEYRSDVDGFRFRLDSARIGSTVLSGEIGAGRQGTTTIPFAKVDIETVNTDEIAGMFAPSGPDTESAPTSVAQGASHELSVDIPLLPHEIELIDSDLQVTLRQLAFGRLELADVSLAARARDGVVKAAPFGARITGVTVNGAFDADFRSKTPSFGFQLQARKMDIGALLDQIGVVSGLSLTADGFDLAADMKGASTRQLLLQSSFRAQLSDAQLKLGASNPLIIDIPSGKLTGAAGQPISVLIDGRLDGVPVAINMVTDSLASFATPRQRHRVGIEMVAANTFVALTGEAPLPVRPDALDFTLDLRGSRLDDLEDLLDIELPRVGPYRGTGGFGSNASGLYVKDLKLQVGSSSLRGDLDLNLKADPPKLVLALVAESIQLDDFDPNTLAATAAPSPGTSAPRAHAAPLVSDRILRIRIQQELVRRGYDPGGIDGIFGSKTRASMRAFQLSEGLPATGEPDPELLALLLESPGRVRRQASGAPADGQQDGATNARPTPTATAPVAGPDAATMPGDELAGILAPETLRRLDAEVSVDVRQVLSGSDSLGRGQARLMLAGGRISIDPLTLEVPGGTVELALQFQPGETTASMSVRARVDRLDYGLLARRIEPTSAVRGLVSVDVDLSMDGDKDKLLASANGKLKVAVEPEDLDAGIFDLWAVNLFSALMSDLDQTDSKVNCLVARLVAKDGVMRPESILVDTSRIQASGDGVIDFRAETITFTAAPRSKRPEMFSAQTPIQVDGRFRDFDVGIAPGGQVGTAVRFITSPVTVPIKWVFKKNMPADGAAACHEAWSGEGAATGTARD